MTDPTVADAVYLEPLTVDAIEAVIAREKPEGLLAGLGGQTALNLATALAEAGVLERHDVRLLGTPLEAIRMAEDREAFRDLLDRIDQPYAPSFIVEGPDEDARHASAEAALADIGLPAIIRPAFTLGGTGGGIVETEDAYWERVRSGLRASPIKQVMIERCLVGWQEIEYEVMRDAEDTCIAVCSMENVDPLGVHTGDSIVVAPVQTLTDQVHQRLRSAALAIIRALGVEGGCNVQFALSPDSTEYAVIEVNPRVSRSSALASKATGYPIARVAAQIAAGRTLAEIPNVVTGTTVAAFEPALDYVVVKLPRFPFDKFPTADRRLGSQMKATGEVMAIDRTFGAALNKALRGLEQAGAGPLGEDPSWQPTFDYLAAVYAGDRRGDPLRRGRGHRHPLDRRARRRLREHPLRPALGRADRAPAVRRAVGLAAVAGPRPAPPRRAAGDHPRGDRDQRPGSSPRWAATSASSTTCAPPARASPTRPTRTAPALLATAKRAALRRPRPGRPGRACRRRPCGRPGPSSASRPGYAMVDTCAAEFAAETPYFYSTYASAGSPPEAPPVARPGRPRHRQRPGPDRAGDRVRLLRRPGRGRPPARGLERGDGQLQPRDGVHRLRRRRRACTSSRSTPRACGASSTFESGGTARRARRTRCRRVVAFGGQTPLNLAAPLVHAGVPLLGSSLETIDQAEERTRFSALLDRLGHPAARGRHGGVDRGGAHARRAHRLPGHRPAVVRHRRPRHRLRLLARGPRPPPRRGGDRRPRPAGAHRPLPRGHRGRRRRGLRRHGGAHPGAARARRARRRPLGRLDRGVPAAARLGGRPST